MVFIIRIFYGLNFKLYLHAGNIDSFINKNIINKYLYLYLSKFSAFIFLRIGLYNSLKINLREVSILNNFYPKINQNCNKKINDKIKILFLSNYIENKGVLLAVKIFKRICLENKNIQCFFVGSDADITREFLSKLIDKKFKNQIIIKGPLYGNDKYDFMKNCDFFIFPSKYEREAFPVVSLEAVACGCLFISSSVNGINEIFDTERTENNDDKIITHFIDNVIFIFFIK